jgi:hypothetical protein
MTTIEAKEANNGVKSDIFTSAAWIVIFTSLFFARNIITLFPLFLFGLVIGIFEWIKLYNYKKRRRK